MEKKLTQGDNKFGESYNFIISNQVGRSAFLKVLLCGTVLLTVLYVVHVKHIYNKYIHGFYIITGLGRLILFIFALIVFARI